MTINRDDLMDRFGRTTEAGVGALFVGATLSMDAGVPGWASSPDGCASRSRSLTCRWAPSLGLAKRALFRVFLCHARAVSVGDDPLFDGKPRKHRDERQLTDELARLCRQDAGLRTGFALALVRLVEAKQSPALTALVAKAGPKLSVEAERHLGRAQNKLFQQKGGRPDLVITAHGLVLVLEAKIDASLQKGQRERYLNDPLLFPRGVAGGLILVVEKPPPTSFSLGGLQGRNRWLGTITWRQLIPALEELEADDDGVGTRWQEVLEAIQQPGDLGDGAMRWGRGTRTVGQRNRKILKSAEVSSVHALDRGMKDSLIKLPALRPSMRLRVAGKDRADLGLYVPETAPSPALTITVHGTRRPLAVTVTVHGVVKAVRGDRGIAAQAAQKLRHAGFKLVAGGDYVIMKRFGDGSGEDEPSPPAALRAVLDPVLGAIGASGALNGRVNRWGRYRHRAVR